MADEDLTRTKKPKASSLRYVIELRSSDGQCERVLARAHSAAVARAVFEACSQEFPGRILTLRESRREIARTAAPDKVG